MTALDTNILVRFLIKDDAKQAQRVYKLFQDVEAKKGTLFVPLFVVLELVWVLESVYEISRQEILASMKDLGQMPILAFEAQPAIQGFISSAQKTKLDLSDLLIAHSAVFSGCERLLTFDKRASKLEFFELLA